MPHQGSMGSFMNHREASSLGALVEDNACFGCHSSSRYDKSIEKCEKIIDEISEETVVSWNSCQRILIGNWQMFPLNLLINF